jgi:hypothetical protein
LIEADYGAGERRAQTAIAPAPRKPRAIALQVIGRSAERFSGIVPGNGVSFLGRGSIVDVGRENPAIRRGPRGA